jgi:hypothetical protein
MARPVLAEWVTARLDCVRVRKFELRLVGATLVTGWVVAAGLVLIAYRPGGPLDVLVGLTMTVPIAIAVAGVAWPPVTRGSRAFNGMIWLGIAALLCLVPSIIGVIEQIQALGSQTLLPSLEAAYPWLLALAATSLFSGLGLARRLRGAAALRRRRFVDGAIIGVALTLLASSLFAGAAMANELALRDTVPTSSRFGPTDPTGEPPFCDAALAVGPDARVFADLDGTVDLRPIGSVELAGTRDGTDYRWAAYVATDRQLGQAGAARIDRDAWLREPGGAWVRVAPARVATETIDLQVLATALTPGFRATAEDRGVEVIEGARARRCRVAVDGVTFEAAFPQIRWLVGDADLHRWRGQLDYWVFLDGQLGQVAGDAGGDAAGLGTQSIVGAVTVRLTVTERDRPVVIHPPDR